MLPAQGTFTTRHPWVEEPDVSALVTEDDTPVDNFPSEKQQRLLTEPLYSSWSGPPPGKGGQKRSFLVAANVGMFAAPKEPAIVPDVLLSLDVELQKDWWEKKNRSYLFWELGKPPDVVLEVVSNQEGEELGAKRRRYAGMKVAHYVVWDPTRALGGPELRVFELRGDLYAPVERAWFEGVGLGLVTWEGTYEERHDRWLRWCDGNGVVVPTGAERAAWEHARAESEHARAERLAERLRALGIDPDKE